MSADLPSSWRDYQSLMAKEVASLSPAGALTFALWCAEYLLRRYRTELLESYAGDEVDEMLRIVDQLWAKLTADRNELEETCSAAMKRVDKMGPQDDVSRIEVHPLAMGALEAFYAILATAVDGDRFAAAAGAAGDAIVNSLDWLVGGPHEYSLDDMFEHPVLRTELTTQTQFIAKIHSSVGPLHSLRGESHPDAEVDSRDPSVRRARPE